jgi:hypothetical protein
MLDAIDPFADTTMDRAQMACLLIDIEAALSKAKHSPERHGLRRLPLLAERCRDDAELVLVFIGD